MRSERLIVPDNVTETVSVCPLVNYEEKRSASYVDFVTMKRYNEEVKMAPILTPVAFRDTVICLPDSGKKRFKSQTLYEPKVKPRKFSDTLIIFPKRPQRSFVTLVDYHIDECRRWFKTTLEFKARTYTTSKILNDTEDEDVSDTDTSDEDESKEKMFISDGPGASQIFLPRWNKDSYDENKNIPQLVNGELLLNGY
ncbi:refilin-B-like [Mercenaria mercenaria]|uniref:refilin-B-like n=1 Tax=Mercenaria mercenaria TaxID=6596 RepID=UPI001E1D39A9|nr:refilin-B-like [Mercenaria mercenaria]XP_045171602.1 refilin-B-like [Mercenaria mercenaria]